MHSEWPVSHRVTTVGAPRHSLQKSIVGATRPDPMLVVPPSIGAVPVMPTTTLSIHRHRVRDFADDRIKGGERRCSLHVGHRLGIVFQGLEICLASPLRVVDDLGAIQAAMDTGRDESGKCFIVSSVARTSTSTSSACLSGLTVKTFTSVMRERPFSIVAMGRPGCKPGTIHIVDARRVRRPSATVNRADARDTAWTLTEIMAHGGASDVEEDCDAGVSCVGPVSTVVSMADRRCNQRARGRRAVVLNSDLL